MSMNFASLAKATALFKAGNHRAAYEEIANYIITRTTGVLDFQPPAQSVNPVISVIVSGPEDHILRCLSSLEIQDYPDMEIIVATSQKIKAGERYGVLNCPASLPLAERKNIAALHARGPIFSFIDSRMMAEPDFARRTVHAFTTYDIFALRGRILPLEGFSPCYMAEHLDKGEVPSQALLDIPGNCAMLGDVFNQLGGANPLVHERSMLLTSVVLAGAGHANRIMYCPEVRVRMALGMSKETVEHRLQGSSVDRDFTLAVYDGANEVLSRQDRLNATPLAALVSGLEIPRKDGGPGLPEFDTAVTLTDANQWEQLADQFVATQESPFTLARYAALAHTGRFDEARSLLGTMSITEENRIRNRTLDMLEAMAKLPCEEPRVHILLLACNREKEVLESLRQLAATNWGNYALYLLDNGSRDNTWLSLKEGATFFPASVEVHMERTPTNIGRPIGHNWLIEKYDHKAAEYICIADDDLFALDPDWLRKMVDTMRVFPKAGVVGGKAVGPETPRMIHGGRRMIRYMDREDLIISGGREEPDFGQQDFICPVDHVIGCLHIYRTELLTESPGLFDPGLSPCQRVDVDHHLRVRLAGYDIVYNGFIQIGHLRAGGKQSQSSDAALGNLLGNQVKMLYKHHPDAICEFMLTQAAQREKWLKGKE